MMNFWKAIALGAAATVAAALFASHPPSSAPSPAQIEAQSACGGITCPASKLCCFDCSGQPYCAPKRLHECPLLPCPPPAVP